jgi:hypothetical protein
MSAGWLFDCTEKIYDCCRHSLTQPAAARRRRSGFRQLSRISAQIGMTAPGRTADLRFANLVPSGPHAPKTAIRRSKALDSGNPSSLVGNHAKHPAPSASGGQYWSASSCRYGAQECQRPPRYKANNFATETARTRLGLGRREATRARFPADGKRETRAVLRDHRQRPSVVRLSNAVNARWPLIPCEYGPRRPGRTYRLRRWVKGPDNSTTL